MSMVLQLLSECITKFGKEVPNYRLDNIRTVKDVVEVTSLNPENSLPAHRPNFVALLTSCGRPVKPGRAFI